MKRFRVLHGADHTAPQTPSWQWFYPFHFAPFAADFEDVAEMNVSFEKGEPFKPYEQLMGVFPASRSVLFFFTNSTPTLMIYVCVLVVSTFPRFSIH